MQLVNAPAKINLALHVTGQRDDGYHLIDTLVVFAKTINASDTVIASKALRDGFTISGARSAPLIQDDAPENLMVKTRDQVRLDSIASNAPAPAVHLSLEKRLPVAAGLGGGSADAAATIKALYRLWGAKPETSGRHIGKLAAQMGADVPMCLYDKPLRAQGIGERITPLTSMPKLHLVLVNCNKPVSTPAIFEALSHKENTEIGALPRAQDFTPWLAQNTRNDLTEAASNLCKPITQTLRALDKNGAIMSRMSGSGATCFGIFESAVAARMAAETIAKAKPSWWVEATHTEAVHHEQN